LEHITDKWICPTKLLILSIARIVTILTIKILKVYIYGQILSTHLTRPIYLKYSSPSQFNKCIGKARSTILNLQHQWLSPATFSISPHISNSTQ
jgi:hypothetical protein